MRDISFFVGLSVAVACAGLGIMVNELSLRLRPEAPDLGGLLGGSAAVLAFMLAHVGRLALREVVVSDVSSTREELTQSVLQLREAAYSVRRQLRMW